MTVLASFLAYAAAHAPEIVEAVAKLAQDFANDHPELVEPPPTDREVEINAEIDVEISDL